MLKKPMNSGRRSSKFAKKGKESMSERKRWMMISQWPQKNSKRESAKRK